MAFHADAQRPALAPREGQHLAFGMFELRQHPLGQRQQRVASLGQAQRAAFARPHRRAQPHFELLDCVAQRRLGQAQHVGSGGQ